ncbi:hypothetical protein [Millisia brevis]|uniref:hypothetical protein n=1 Tax=Millisia brevis TaxID=264148 RepID=UPI000833CBEB|nr:hypothetical protein [Millisia brevis]
MAPENESGATGSDVFDHLPFGIGSSPYAADIDRVAEQTAYIAGNRQSLESQLGGGTDPNYANTLEAFDGYSHQQMYDLVQALQPGSMSQAAGLWIDAGTSVKQSSTGLMLAAIAELDHNWKGGAADEVRAMVGRINQGAIDTGSVMQSVGMRMNQATTAAEALKSTMPPPAQPVPLPMDVLGSPVTAYAAAEQRAEEQRRQAIELLNSIYTPQLRPTGDAVPAFGSPTSGSGGGAGGAAGGGAATGAGTGSGAGGSALGPGGFGGGTGTGTPADTSAAAAGDAGGPAGSAANGSTAPGSGSTSPQGAGANQPGGAAGVPPAGAGVGSTRPAASSGSGVGGFGVPGGSAGAGSAGGGRGGSTGGGAGGSGAGRPGAGGGLGGVAGAGPGVIGGGGVAGGGGVGTRPGYMPMGMMPASRGAGGDDAEHRAASYLVDPENRNELIGEIPATVTPVLGEWKEES